jgi:hypothetical protein
MVTPDDHIREDVIAADDAVPDRVARTGDAHGKVAGIGFRTAA